jgi:hypothetical protein
MWPKRREGSIRSAFKSAIVALTLASASFVGAQPLQTLCSFNGTNRILGVERFGTTTEDAVFAQASKGKFLCRNVEFSARITILVSDEAMNTPTAHW